MHQIVYQFSPHTPLGELTALPGPIAVFRWPLLKEKGKRKGEIWQKRGREGGEGERGEGGGKGRRGKGRGGKGRAAMTLWHGAPNVLIRPCSRCSNRKGSVANSSTWCLRHDEVATRWRAPLSMNNKNENIRILDDSWIIQSIIQFHENKIVR